MLIYLIKLIWILIFVLLFYLQLHGAMDDSFDYFVNLYAKFARDSGHGGYSEKFAKLKS